MEKYNGEELMEGDKDGHYQAFTLVESFTTKEEIFDFLIALKEHDDNEFDHQVADYILTICLAKNLYKDGSVEDRQKLISLYDDIGKGYS